MDAEGAVAITVPVVGAGNTGNGTDADNNHTVKVHIKDDTVIRWSHPDLLSTKWKTCSRSGKVKSVVWSRKLQEGHTT